MSNPPWQQSPFTGWPPPAGSAPPAPLRVDAGPNAPAVLGVPQALAGSASGGTAPYTFLWSVQSKPVGGVVAFVDATNPTTNVTLSGAEGVYVLKLIAHDAVGTVAGDTVTLSVPFETQLLWSDGAINRAVTWNGQPVRW